MKVAVVLAVVAVARVASADPGAGTCPAAIKDAAAAAVPGSIVTKCHKKKKHDAYEAKLATQSGGKAEVELDGDGKVVEIEEAIPLDQVIPAVADAFAKKYPKAKPTKAEKSTRPGKQDAYELAFTLAGARREATFLADGTFVEVEDD